MTSSRPTPIDLHILQTRVRLLKAARELFLTGPCTSVTVEDICMAAGVSKGGFYHHFPDKEAVFLTIALDELRREIGSAADVAEESLRRNPTLQAEASGDESILPPKGGAAEQLRSTLRRPRSVAGLDASALLVDVWALAPRRRQTLRQVQVLHRQALRQAPRLLENGDTGDREALARIAFLMSIGFLVHRALTREVATDRRGYKKAAG